MPERGRRPASALEAFTSVMAWGYGRVGYGPFRVGRVLASVPDPGTRLQAAVGELARAGPVAAHSLLGDCGIPALPGLGPAFGTKFLYFSSRPGDRTALILDSLVATWLRQNTSIQLNEARWSTATYQRYLTAMSSGLPRWPSLPTTWKPASSCSRPAPRVASGTRLDKSVDNLAR